MDLSIVFYGTGPSAPSARRSTACVLIRAGGRRIMVDCGEGSQRQMQRSTGLVSVDEIFLTHYHADHFLGLPGLLKTYDLNGRSEPLEIFGPAGIEELFSTLSQLVGRLSYELVLTEMQAGEEVAYEGYVVRPFEVEHRVRAFGYALVEDERPGHLDAEKAAALGVESGPDMGRLTEGETVPGSAGPVTPEQVMGEPRAGRKIVISGDSRPCTATKVEAGGASVLIHDATFLDEDLDRAAETAHSTARQAAALAADADVGMLALVHISSRYYGPDVLAEAGEEFANVVAPGDFDLIEIPFPERGQPRLLERGARPPRG